MGNLDHWRGRKKYTLTQAVLLHIGKSPGLYLSDIECLRHRSHRFKYIEEKRRFLEAIKTHELHAEVVELGEIRFAGDCDEFNVDMDRSFVYTKDVEDWLRKKKIPSKFFLKKPPGQTYIKAEGIDPSHIARRRLETTRCNLEKEIEVLKEDHKFLLEERETIKSEIDSLMDGNKDALNIIEKRSYLNMIAVLLKFIPSNYPKVCENSSYSMPSKLINEIVYNYYIDGEIKYRGLSRENLYKRFGHAVEFFESKDSRVRRKKC